MSALPAKPCQTLPTMGNNQSQTDQTDQTDQTKPTNQISFRVSNVKPGDLGSLDTHVASHAIRSRLLDRDQQKLVVHAHSMPVTLVAHTPTKNQLVSAMVLAFDQHLDLMLRPQHFWLAVTQGVAMHVNTFASQLRSKLVSHQGRKVLRVDVTEELVKTGSIDWQAAAASFANQIHANTIDQATKLFQCKMSNTTQAEHVCVDMTTMDACKSYFEYQVSTCCGFPRIYMQGTLADWKLLKSQTHDLVTRICMPEFARAWLSILDTVFDKLIAAYDTQHADTAFWESMAKKGGTSGSGATTWINGWVNVFFPYRKPGEPNEYCQAFYSPSQYNKTTTHWSGKPVLVQVGLDVRDFPDGLSSAPVELDNNCLEFRGGFVGVEKTHMYVTPAVGWFVARGVSDRTKDWLTSETHQQAFEQNYILTDAGVAIQLEDFADTRLINRVKL